MTDEIPPKRHESAEYTVVLPRESLPPVSTVAGPTVEQLREIQALSDAERARRDEQDSIGTLVSCDWCGGHGMVSPEKAAEWRAKYPELEPIPPSRPEAAA